MGARRRIMNESLYTVQRGDWLTALNDKKTGEKMLQELGRNTEPYETRKMRLLMERELDDRFEVSDEASSPSASKAKRLSQLESSASAASLPPSRPPTQSPKSMGT